MADIPKVQQVIAVLWPGFLVAAAATVVFFTVFDPEEIAVCKGTPGLTRLGAYTVGFFIFWMLTSLSSLLTCYFQRPCETARREDRGR
jgi:hypothetical protein